jgi:hypothetical protein
VAAAASVLTAVLLVSALLLFCPPFHLADSVSAVNPYSTILLLLWLFVTELGCWQATLKRPNRS